MINSFKDLYTGVNYRIYASQSVYEGKIKEVSDDSFLLEKQGCNPMLLFLKNINSITMLDESIELKNNYNKHLTNMFLKDIVESKVYCNIYFDNKNRINSYISGVNTQDGLLFLDSSRFGNQISNLNKVVGISKKD